MPGVCDDKRPPELLCEFVGELNVGDNVLFGRCQEKRRQQPGQRRTFGRLLGSNPGASDREFFAGRKEVEDNQLSIQHESREEKQNKMSKQKLER